MSQGIWRRAKKLKVIRQYWWSIAAWRLMNISPLYLWHKCGCISYARIHVKVILLSLHIYITFSVARPWPIKLFLWFTLITKTISLSWATINFALYTIITSCFFFCFLLLVHYSHLTFCTLQAFFSLGPFVCPGPWLAPLSAPGQTLACGFTSILLMILDTSTVFCWWCFLWIYPCASMNV